MFIASMKKLIELFTLEADGNINFEEFGENL